MDETPDDVTEVQDLVSRHRGGLVLPAVKRVSDKESFLDLKNRRREVASYPSGKFVLQSRRSEDPLHFIHRVHSNCDQLNDPETEQLVRILRSTVTSAEDDRDRKRDNNSLITAALINQSTMGDGQPTSVLASSPLAKRRDAREKSLRRSLQQVRFDELPTTEFFERPQPPAPPTTSLDDDEFHLSDSDSDDGQRPVGRSAEMLTDPAKLQFQFMQHMDIPYIDDASDVSKSDDDLDIISKSDDDLSEHRVSGQERDQVSTTEEVTTDEDGSDSEPDYETIDRSAIESIQPPDVVVSSVRDSELTAASKAIGDLEISAENFITDSDISADNLDSLSCNELNTEELFSDEDDYEEVICVQNYSPEKDDARVTVMDPIPEDSADASDSNNNDDLPSKPDWFEQAEEPSSPPPLTESSGLVTSSSAEDVPLSEKEQLSSKEEAKTKERSSISGSLDDLDFTALPSCPLNLTPNKERIQLRQKGSLAQRRKPTRPSMKPGLANDSTAMEINGDEEEEAMVEEEEEEEEEGLEEVLVHQTMPGLEMATHQDNIAASEGPTLKSGKTLQGVKIALPGFSSGEKPKLRSKPRPSPPTDPVPNENTPPWMGESRLRKSRPPRGEVEKMKQETEPEKPSWMKDAAAKRRRASQLLIAKERQDSEAEEQTSSPSTTAPWLVESASRRRHSNLNSDPSMEVDDAFLPHNEDEQHAKVVLASNGVNSDQSCDDDSSVPAWRLEIKSRRKSRPPSVLPEKPPMEEDIPLWKKELAERRKTRGDSVAAIESIKVGPKTEEEDVVPPWKLEIEERKKKSLTSTASHRVFNPLNPDPLSPSVKSETPEWAKLAAERRARRKQSTHLDELERQVEINDPN